MSCACSLCTHATYHITDVVLKQEVPSQLAQAVVPSRYQAWSINLAFFLVGMGLNSSWGTISFTMPYWLNHYQGLISPTLVNMFWIFLLTAYNLPGLPVQLFQISFDNYINYRLKSTRLAFLLRGILSFSILIIAVLCLPLSQISLVPPFFQFLDGSPYRFCNWLGTIRNIWLGISVSESFSSAFFYCNS